MTLINGDILNIYANGNLYYRSSAIVVDVAVSLVRRGKDIFIIVTTI